MGCRAKGRVEHTVLDADDRGISRVRRTSALAAIPGLARRLCDRPHGEANARDASLRALAARPLAARAVQSNNLVRVGTREDSAHRARWRALGSDLSRAA